MNSPVGRRAEWSLIFKFKFKFKFKFILLVQNSQRDMEICLGHTLVLHNILTIYTSKKLT